MFSIAKKQTNF